MIEEFATYLGPRCEHRCILESLMAQDALLDTKGVVEEGRERD